MNEREAVNAFFDQMRPVAEEVKRQAKERGNSFNMLDYMRLDEIGLSSMIADLLDPQGAHGQGAVFLAEFMGQLQGTAQYPHSLENWSVKKETWVRTGRIDIMICDAGGDPKILIENKPFANQGEQQLCRYAELIAPDRDQFLIYLNGTNQPPVSLTAEKKELLGERFVAASYRNNGSSKLSLEHWLEECILRAQAEKIQWFLRDFLSFVQSRFATVYIDENTDDVSEEGNTEQ